MWKHDKAANSTSEPSTAQSQPGRRSFTAGFQAADRERSCEYRQVGHHQGRAEQSRGSHDRRSGRGKIELKDHTLTIGSTGKTKAEVFAKTVIVMGAINGNIAASEKVDIRAGGTVDGNIVAPRVAIAEGACFRGSIDMQRKSEQQGQGSQQSRVAGLAEPPPVVAPRPAADASTAPTYEEDNGAMRKKDARSTTPRRSRT